MQKKRKHQYEPTPTMPRGPAANLNTSSAADAVERALSRRRVATSLIAIMATGAAAAGTAGPVLVNAVTVGPKSKEDEKHDAMLLLQGLGLTTGLATLGLLHSEVESGIRRLSQAMQGVAGKLDELDAIKDSLDVAIDDLGVVTREVRGLALERGAPDLTPTPQDSERLMVNRSFAGAGRGVATTREPRMATETRMERNTSGGYNVCAADVDVPDSFDRLRPDHPCSRWRLLIPVEQSRPCLEAIAPVAWSIDHYARIAAYRGRPLDLRKLEVRLIAAPMTGVTTVYLPREGGAARSSTTVLQYTAADAVTGKGRLAVSVHGPLHDAAMLQLDEWLARSTVVPTGALQYLLGDCFPGRNGRIEPAAVERWLGAELPSIAQLAHWRPEWSANPDQA